MIVNLCFPPTMVRDSIVITAHHRGIFFWYYPNPPLDPSSLSLFLSPVPPEGYSRIDSAVDGVPSREKVMEKGLGGR